MTTSAKTKETEESLRKRIAELELERDAQKEEIEKVTADRDAKHQAALDATRQMREAKEKVLATADADLRSFQFPSMFYMVNPGFEDNLFDNEAFSMRRVENQAELDALMSESKKTGTRWECDPNIFHVERAKRENRE